MECTANVYSVACMDRYVLCYLFLLTRIGTDSILESVDERELNRNTDALLLI
ncbi:hypothetical protein [Paenibacillus shirakamiensis]|nr:hypothetical protein [Paenibacillus shirakamiensis]